MTHFVAVVGGVMVAYQVANAFKEHVLKAGWGFAINANVTLNTNHYGYSLAGAKAFLITEEGIGNVIIYPFDTTQACLYEGGKLWCCWLGFNDKGHEIGSGGVGFAHQTIRQNGMKWLSAKN